MKRGDIMSLAEKLVNDFNELPEDKKIEVIDFVEFLKKKQEVSLEELMDNVIEENKIALEELAK
jgi:hypothetical protein